jgi:hypothetical protein
MEVIKLIRGKTHLSFKISRFKLSEARNPGTIADCRFTIAGSLNIVHTMREAQTLNKKSSSAALRV